MSEGPTGRGTFPTQGGRPGAAAAGSGPAGDGAGLPAPSGAAALRAKTGALKAAGPVVAWLAAVGCGWKAGGSAWAGATPGAQVDILDVVLHGAAAWVGVLVLWTAGVCAYEKLIDSQQAGGAAEKE